MGAICGVIAARLFIIGIFYTRRLLLIQEEIIH